MSKTISLQINMNKLICMCLILGLFALAKSALPCAHEGKMCAGIAGIQCCEGEGLHCFALDKNVADWSGKCVKGCRDIGESCGGIAGLRCCESESATGLKCHITATYPDAMGKCVRA